MSPGSLPERPSLEHLKHEARDLQRSAAAGDAEALSVVEQHLPGRGGGALKLTEAQIVVARRYGFPSWSRLRARVEAINAFAARPDRVPAAHGDDVAELVRLGCLTYGDDDGPARFERASAMLAAQPWLADDDLYAACVAGRLEVVRRLLAAGAAGAERRGGPFAWPPLLYATASRIGETAAAPAIARLLIEHGASPDAGYLWDGVNPFTALTHAFGGGELGTKRQPHHPHSIELARVLLEAGADPNDSQTLYNRMFEPDDSHLVLLFEFGLGTGDGGVWRHRAGGRSPAAELREQLRWAATHGMVQRVQLLLDHHVDATSPFDDGHTAADLAVMNGHADLGDLIVALGGAPPRLTGVDAAIAAVVAVDRSVLESLQVRHPEVVERLRAERPGLLTWLAANGKAEAIELLVKEFGFDVNARGRGDVPVEQPWQTPLHEAAGAGNLALARRLLELGADPNVRDARFDAPPLGWARYGEHADLVALLEPLTSAA